MAIVAVAFAGVAHAQGEPPGRVGRLAVTQGTVSFHDPQQDGWIPAVVNTPLTTGAALWTEPNALGEVSLSGTRIRLGSTTQLDMLAVDDTQTRLQLDQGRIDVRSFAMDTEQPYEVLTPRGTARLLEQGDYYIEAGSTQDATRLGVRSGRAQFEALDGQDVPVRPGEVAELLGDADNPQIRIVKTAPPPMPAYWAQRDRQVRYDQPPQYLNAAMTGYEDLNAYGAWSNDPTLGQVWMPRTVPAGWEPYRTGRWINQPPYGWTWVDEQPWGFAPYHYGRWARVGSRWAWVPPQRDVRPVYAPALVAFVGGLELAATLGNRAAAPVGWFPLGPREVYVPPYTANRDYYLRLNRSARVQDEILRDRWERAQRREARAEREAFVNRRFATVVPANAFVRSQPVMRAALRVTPQQIEAAPVAAIAAPPAPTARLTAAGNRDDNRDRARDANRDDNRDRARDANRARDHNRDRDQDRNREAATPNRERAGSPATDLREAKTANADMPTLAPAPATKAEARHAPGPKIAATEPKASGKEPAKREVPRLAPRHGAAPPVLKGEVTPVQRGKAGDATHTSRPQADRPDQAARPTEAGKGGDADKPATPQAPSRAGDADGKQPPKLPAPQAQSKPGPVEPPKPDAREPAERAERAQPPKAEAQPDRTQGPKAERQPDHKPAAKSEPQQERAQAPKGEPQRGQAAQPPSQAQTPPAKAQPQQQPQQQHQQQQQRQRPDQQGQAQPHETPRAAHPPQQAQKPQPQRAAPTQQAAPQRAPAQQQHVQAPQPHPQQQARPQQQQQAPQQAQAPSPQQQQPRQQQHDQKGDNQKGDKK